jgi:hypothetical protein
VVFYLVGGFNLPLWKMMEWKSVGMMTFPTEWKNKKCSKLQTTNQSCFFLMFFFSDGEGWMRCDEERSRGMSKMLVSSRSKPTRFPKLGNNALQKLGLQTCNLW